MIGSTELVATMLELDLVDELRLMIDPLVLGGGKRVFREDGVRRAFRLVDGQVTGTGAILATYASA
jgi:dihydrofolate reductase